jgi:hypothetical protein
MLCYAMLCYAMLCYAMLCYAMLCYAMLCYAMLCYAMLCYADAADSLRTNPSRSFGFIEKYKFQWGGAQPIQVYADSVRDRQCVSQIQSITQYVLYKHTNVLLPTLH